MKFKIPTANNFTGRFKRSLNALYKQRNSVLRERPQLNKFLYVSSLIYREKLKQLHSQVVASELSICDVTRGSID